MLELIILFCFPIQPKYDLTPVRQKFRMLTDGHDGEKEANDGIEFYFIFLVYFYEQSIHFVFFLLE